MSQHITHQGSYLLISISLKVCDKINDSFPNFNDYIVEVW